MSEKIYNDEFILRCDCRELWHSTVFTIFFEGYKVFPGTENEMVSYDLFVAQNIENACFWERIKNCFKYLFKQRKFWNYGETYINMLEEEKIEDVENLIVFLQNACKMSRNNLKRIEDDRDNKKEVL